LSHGYSLRQQFHDLRLNEWLTHFSPATRAFLTRATGYICQGTGDIARSRLMALLGELANVREQQASSLAYFDCLWAFPVVALGLVFLVPLMRRSVAEKGAHVGGV
jgi:MFS transporter, DHA2 family, multidrug resistance protein